MDYTTYAHCLSIAEVARASADAERLLKHIGSKLAAANHGL